VPGKCGKLSKWFTSRQRHAIVRFVNIPAKISGENLLRRKIAGQANVARYKLRNTAVADTIDKFMESRKEEETARTDTGDTFDAASEE